VSLSARDRKIALVLGPLVLLLGFWFLLYSPKKAEVAKADSALAKAEERRDTAEAELGRLSTSKQSFASDYAQLVRLGKAVPSSVDVPSVIVQLDAAARGTDIKLGRIAVVTGEAAEAAPAPAPSSAPPAEPGSGDGSQPAAAGGAPAQSTPGSTAEDAGAGVTESNAATDASAQKSEGGGGAGGAAAAPAATPGVCPPGLQCIPLEFEFSGKFFDLASFFHRLKRFVHLTDNRVNVSGRLLTIDSLTFATETFPQITAEVKATAYLSDEAQTVAGAAPAPGQAAPAAPAPASASTGSSGPPVATATP